MQLNKKNIQIDILLIFLALTVTSIWLCLLSVSNVLVLTSIDVILLLLNQSTLFNFLQKNVAEPLLVCQYRHSCCFQEYVTSFDYLGKNSWKHDTDWLLISETSIHRQGEDVICPIDRKSVDMKTVYLKLRFHYYLRFSWSYFSYDFTWWFV